ncbi:hypothetical protein [Undibacterium terreum]|uniref:Uncharacterized protein n=1 Tax=Undibacterium terreum TaxID=1224302 RepID=A0A916UPA3_9BURK|nr:hypothetical protein [Undibacterium terreum]GGC78331.1 hypothetical protein GCM10011396_26880 [Undibacterium terreum]
MKLAENMDGIVIAAIAAAIASGLMTAVVPAPQTMTAATTDGEVHTVVITGKRLTDS